MFLRWASMTEKTCVYCKRKFTMSLRNRNQRTCGSAECQRRRRYDYHRGKIVTDSVYRDECRRSRKKWRDKNPDYMRRYRKRRKSKACGEAERLRLLNDLSRLVMLVKTNSVPRLPCYRTKDFLIWRFDASPELWKSRAGRRLYVVCWPAPADTHPAQKIKNCEERGRCPWSVEDDRTLFDLAGLKDSRLIARLLHRPESGVESRMRSLARCSHAR